MNSWVLVVTRNPLLVPEIEEASRLAGLSPRRAPDLLRARVLCDPEDPPAAIIVDPESCGEEAFAVIDKLGTGTLAIVLLSGERPEDEARAGRFGARALPSAELTARLPELVRS